MEDLNNLDNPDAWRGAAAVWTNKGNIRQHREQCLAGLKSGLGESNAHSKVVAGEMDQIFHGKDEFTLISTDLISRCFFILSADRENTHDRLFGFHEWLNATSQLDPQLALAATEIYLQYINRSKPYFYDYEDNLTQLMTRLFAESEEQEESDAGAMLQRVVAVQDTLLSLGLNGVADWLKAAERP